MSALPEYKPDPVAPAELPGPQDTRPEPRPRGCGRPFGWLLLAFVSTLIWGLAAFWLF